MYIRHTSDEKNLKNRIKWLKKTYYTFLLHVFFFFFCLSLLFVSSLWMIEWNQLNNEKFSSNYKTTVDLFFLWWLFSSSSSSSIVWWESCYIYTKPIYTLCSQQDLSFKNILHAKSEYESNKWMTINIRNILIYFDITKISSS